MLAWKISPFLASGCSVVVKLVEETSLTALWVAELAMEAGIPSVVFNVVPGMGPEGDEPLGRHMDVDMTFFTGSMEVGMKFGLYITDLKSEIIVLGWAERTQKASRMKPKNSIEWSRTS